MSNWSGQVNGWMQLRDRINISRHLSSTEKSFNPDDNDDKEHILYTLLYVVLYSV